MEEGRYNTAKNFIEKGKNMQSVNIKLSTIEDIRNFVSIVLTFDFEVDLQSGRYLIDAKSIMGIFSLDLMNPIRLIAHTDDGDMLFSKIKPFVVE